MFKDKSGVAWDFGDGRNEFGDYRLVEKGGPNPNRQYVNRRFEVTWSLRLSRFYCCEGEMTRITGLRPSIQKLRAK